MRLIDADMLKIDYCRACFRLAFENDQYSDTCESQCGMQQIIDEAPTVDAVHVIRCKNCKYAENDYEGLTYKCRIKLIYTFAESFCSDGIRKENKK